jgi:hypothetical protein
MNVTLAPPLRNVSWNDALWGTLLESIARGQLIPIIGPALSVVKVGDEELTVDRFVARKLIEYLEQDDLLDLDDLPESPSLNDVVVWYARRHHSNDDLYPLIFQIFDANRTVFAPPAALRQLAAIAPLKLFVTTAIDPLLARALRDVRGGQPAVLSYAETRNDIEPGGLRNSAGTVYHILGQVSPIPNEVVISDEDLLEFVSKIQTAPPKKLLDQLSSNYLLFLGGNLPDWLARLFLRSIRGVRLSHKRKQYEIMADDVALRDATLVAFLDDFSAMTRIFAGSAEKFVAELCRRWQERAAQDPQAGQGLQVAQGPQVAPSKAALGAGKAAASLFVSYASEDHDAARRLVDGLKSEGFDVWFDKERLLGGEVFQPDINKAIDRCSLFLPLISHHTGAYNRAFHKEWNAALERMDKYPRHVSFVLPVIIDDSGVDLKDHAGVDERWMKLTTTVAPEGTVSGELIEAIKKALTRLAGQHGG